MTGVNPQYLPNSTSFNSQSKSHAIVIYNLEGDKYKCFDPDTGLIRTIEHDFQSIRSTVEYKLSVEQFKNAIINRNTSYDYVIGFIEEAESYVDNTNQIIQESISGISLYKEIAQDKLNGIRTITDIPNYEDFYSFIKEIVKPIAIDLYNAIKISNNDGSKDELLNLLENYKHTVMNIQDDVRGYIVSNWQATKSDLIDKISQIQLAIIQHIESR